MAFLNRFIPETAKEVTIKRTDKTKKRFLDDREIGPFILDGMDMVVIGLIGLLCIASISVHVFMHPVIVNGTSMYPTFKEGDILSTKNRFTENDLQYGSVIVFKNDATNGRIYIKRIEGVPGDRIAIKNGKLIRNGSAVNDTYGDVVEGGMFEDKETVLDGFFVLGDNRGSSQDSRFIGTVAFNDIIGVVDKEEPLAKLPFSFFD